jgi:glycosyltransferase involved in cell wall biosynthesis
MGKRSKEYTICVIAPNKDVYSETFIRAHIDQLPAKVNALYGYPLPGETSRGESLYSSRLPYRIVNLLGVKYLGYSDGWYKQRLLIQYLIDKHVQAVLAEYGHTGVAMMEVCKKADIPLIVHFHGNDAYSKKILDNEGQSYPELFRNAAVLVVVSQDMHRQLVQLGAPSEKIVVNPCGVDVSKFKGADPANSPPTFIAVGRFVNKKAPNLTLLAFNEVLKVCPDARLMMLGDGPLLEACKQLANALSISDAVDFPGSTSHSDVVLALQQSRVFVQHSVVTSSGNSEGTPVAVLEACATGLPVVATSHGGIKDVILDGETGFLVAEGDIDNMEKSMKKLANDPSLAAKLGTTGRERIIEEFSMDISIKKLWRIIRNVIE